MSKQRPAPTPISWFDRTYKRIWAVGKMGASPWTRQVAMNLILLSEIDPMQVPGVYVGNVKGISLSWHNTILNRQMMMFVSGAGHVEYSKLDQDVLSKTLYTKPNDRNAFQRYYEWCFPRDPTGQECEGK